MHGRPRKATKPEDAAASAAKAEKLRSLQTQLLAYHHQKIYTKEAVELSAKLLETNPESYTTWNYRKLAVEHNLSQAESDRDLVKRILDEELRVVESALRQNFKSYGAWHHRKWVLSKGHSSIDHELRLLDKLQRADARNFHAWNYRRFVVALMNRSEQDELKYTEDMINNNFSNYSAWHNRSMLLSGLMGKKVEGFLPDENIPAEYELVHQAIFTDPDDQSGWFYHHWLLDQTLEAESPDLLSSWPADGSDVKLSGTRWLDGSAFTHTSFHSDSGTFPLILYFNQPVLGLNTSTVAVVSEFKTNEDLVWKPLSMKNSQSAHVWVAHLKICNPESRSFSSHLIKVSLGHSPGIVSSRGFPLSQPSQVAFKVHVQPVETGSAEALDTEMVSWKDENFHICGTKSQESCSLAAVNQPNSYKHQTYSEWRIAAMVKEIECFRELLSLEDSKIGKLTLARLLTALDALTSGDSKSPVHCEEVLQLYTDLMNLDPFHYHYYKDEHSMALLRQVTSSTEDLLRHTFHYRGLNNVVCLRLNNLSLSRMGSVEKLLWVQILDLSHNEIRSTEGLEAMQLLARLNLSHNKLCSFSALDSLRHLKHLEVLDISHNEIGEHPIDTTRYLCSSPLSHSAGSDWLLDETACGIDFTTKYCDIYFALRELSLKQLDVTGNVIMDSSFESFIVQVMPSLMWLDGRKLS